LYISTKMDAMVRKRSSALLQVNTADLRANISDTVNRVAYGHERVVLTRRGRPLVALVPIADLEALEDAARRIRSRTVVRARGSRG
jgi:prevent-host-death family protein